MEFWDTNFSYIDKETQEEIFVSLPEEKSSALIENVPLASGVCYSATGDGNYVGIIRIEVVVVPGNGKITITDNIDIASVMSPLYILHDYRILLDHLLSAEKISDTKQHIVSTLGVQSFNDQEAIYNEEIKRLNTLFNYLGVLSK